MSPSKFVFYLLLATLLGFGLFGYFAYRSSNITATTKAAAAREFQDVLDEHRERPAMLVRGAFGKLTNNLPDRDLPTASPARMMILAYLPDTGNIVRTDIPFWFLRLKSPVLTFALRPTRFDLRTLGLSADDMAAAGPGIVFDDVHANGERFLVWLE